MKPQPNELKIEALEDLLISDGWKVLKDSFAEGNKEYLTALVDVNLVDPIGVQKAMHLQAMYVAREALLEAPSDLLDNLRKEDERSIEEEVS